MHLTASTQLRSTAASDPTRPALADGARAWTYAELDLDVDRLASWLLAQHPGSTEPPVVAVRSTRTTSVALASVAAARAGMIYALVDPTAPPERTAGVLAQLAGLGAPVVLLVDDPADAAHEGATLLDAALADSPATAVPTDLERRPEQVEKVVFTSGSTGVPAGLLAPVARQVQITEWLAENPDVIGPGTRTGMVAAGSLGPTTDLTHASLVLGGQTVLHDVLRDGLAGVPAWLREHRVQAIPLVPTLARYLAPFLDEGLGADGVLPDLRTVVMWGEGSQWSDVASLARHLPRGAHILNTYGATESGMATMTVIDAAAAAEHPGDARVPAGMPVRGTEVLALDELGEEVPRGTPGHLVIVSDRLALGHLGRPDLDAVRFTVLPDGRRACRTGDGGVVDADGMVHVHGRLDDVVKVSAHRVALGELERTARMHPAVAGAAAVARPDGHGAQRLHLFVTATPGAEPDPRWLRTVLARSLPPHFLPSTVDVIAELPVLPNGKVDRRALPKAHGRIVADTGVGEVPSPEVASLLTAFADVLGCAVAPDDDFFELGGDSLRAGRLAARLQRDRGVVVPASLLMQAPTPRALALALADAETAADDPVLVPIRPDGDDPPLFVVHGGGGEVFFARTIAAALPTSVPVHGLQPPRLVGPTPGAPSLQALAERYVAAVRRVRPTGPYRLYGFSLGGVIAFEMATLLQDAGETVDLLALGDSSAADQLPTLVAEHQHRVVLDEQRRAEQTPLARVREQVGHRARQLRRVAGGHTRRSVLWARFEAGAAPDPDIWEDAHVVVYGRLMLTHTARTQFHGPLLLLRATQGNGPADRGWGPHVDGRLDIVDIDGDHNALASGSGLEQVAEALATVVDRRAPVAVPVRPGPA